jgi:hypothetical protein
MTGFSFLNLDDNTVQIQLTSGAINITVRRLGDDDDFEVDTPNQAFTVFQPGHYRVEASADGSYTVISVRAGEGEATGNGQRPTICAAAREALQRNRFALRRCRADFGPPRRIRHVVRNRDHRYDYSRSSQYVVARCGRL